MSPLAANTSQRIVAGFIDVAPLLVVTIAVGVFVPPSGAEATATRIIAGLCLLLKDVTGASGSSARAWRIAAGWPRPRSGESSGT